MEDKPESRTRPPGDERPQTDSGGVAEATDDARPPAWHPQAAGPAFAKGGHTVGEPGPGEGPLEEHGLVEGEHPEGV